MRRVVCVVFDVVAKAPVSPLLVFSSKADAVRAFSAAVMDPSKGYPAVNPQFARDHELRAVGEFADDESCALFPYANFDRLVFGRDVLPVQHMFPGMDKAVNDA